MKYAMITGASRGLGEAIAHQLMGDGYHILGISRSKSDRLDGWAEEHGVTYTHFACDVSDGHRLLQVLEKVKSSILTDGTDEVLLVNNAGVIEPIETVGKLNAEQLQSHIQINLNAPILLSNEVIKLANDLNIRAGIINITSGAAERAVHGWSVYSSTKAAINQFTETLALEQRDHPHLILAFSPGVIDTDMQKEIRSSSEAAFAEVEKFKKLKEEGKLRSAEEVASVLMKLLNNREELENGRVYRLYDLV